MTTTTLLDIASAQDIFDEVVSMAQDYIQEDFDLVKSSQSKWCG